MIHRTDTPDGDPSAEEMIMTVVPVAAVERRSPNRLPTPACPYCGTEDYVVAVIRTKTFIFFRCQVCRERELLPKVIPSVALRRDWLLFC
ncbi:MAG: hypothetical protein EHM55_14110 [Acidobacteria bacterium]|nr:MAG: hypothetical protein EHM55_14110 [Acidobacteriota bacterium]